MLFRLLIAHHRTVQVEKRRCWAVGQFAIRMRAFRAPARIGSPRSLAAQRKLARDDNGCQQPEYDKIKLTHYPLLS